MTQCKMITLGALNKKHISLCIFFPGVGGKKVEKKPKQDTTMLHLVRWSPPHTPSVHGDLPVTAILGTLSEMTNTLQEQGSG